MYGLFFVIYGLLILFSPAILPTVNSCKQVAWGSFISNFALFTEVVLATVVGTIQGFLLKGILVIQAPLPPS